jgi:type I restriction enzyme M protein
MNLYLHGIHDFSIVNDDTLERPAFTKNGRVQQFNVVLANPPYSIKTWNREAFAHDKWGRNFLGTPPQGYADYAFFQHILASMKPITGRCAILFPHGVLFRKEERDMRKKLVESDMLDCIIGLGPNLFFNAPMEACIVIARTYKEPEKRGKVLFINAVKEVTRKNAQSYLEDSHIGHISGAYERYCDEENYAKVATIREIEAQDFSLNIPLYVRGEVLSEPVLSVQECVDDWLAQSIAVKESTTALIALLEKGAQ